ncbi:MAG: peptidoglycan DD-metalloendopeptidase family protein [Bacilli bacterium]|nr:peptidoglycan DD-metalloendopeptidase family protein [Bacilli bacterium]
MLKKFEKICNITLVLAIILPGLFFPSMQAKAENSQTLADMRQALADYEKELNENQEKKKLTQEEIDRITSSITENTNTINRLSDEMIKLQSEITQAEKDIEIKDKEIKEILNFLQISNGESAYLEYAFGAKDFTDFIYRMAISEQLSSYNEELVDEYNTLIENNKKKEKEIEQKQEDLKKAQIELATQKAKLGEELNSTSEAGISIEEAIALQKTTIQFYEKMGCGENETIDACTNRTQILPAGTAFYRPIISGKVTSEFGSRCYWIKQKDKETGEMKNVYKCDLHGGIDMTQSGDAVPVYASAPGRVAGIVREWKCGGNEVMIIHNINGKKYTSMYLHLRTITVEMNQIVTMDTQVGTMGGNPYRETWDECSTGQHVHFTLANGHYGTDYAFRDWYTKFEPNMFNPRIMLNAPAVGGTFTNRFRKY